jgi:hypothetical protein
MASNQEPNSWGNDSNLTDPTCSDPPVNKSQIIIYNIILSFYWLMMIMGLRGLWQIPIALCHIAVFNLRRRLNLAGILIGQVVKSPRMKSIFGTRGLIILETLNIILTTCNLVKFYLEGGYEKLIGFCFTIFVIFYLMVLAIRRVEAGGRKMAIYIVVVMTAALITMVTAEYYDDPRMFGIAMMVVINDWFYLMKMIKAVKTCCLSIELTIPSVTSN